MNNDRLNDNDRIDCYDMGIGFHEKILQGRGSDLDFERENTKRKGENMDYDKLEQELYDYIKSMLGQARFQVNQSQARAYSQEIVLVLESIKKMKEITILNKQIESMSGPKE